MSVTNWAKGTVQNGSFVSVRYLCLRFGIKVWRFIGKAEILEHLEYQRAWLAPNSAFAIPPWGFQNLLLCSVSFPRDTFLPEQNIEFAGNFERHEKKEMPSTKTTGSQLPENKSYNLTL